MSKAIELALPLVQQPVTITDLIKHYGQRLFTFIKKQVKVTEDAEDILQDVWYQLSRQANIKDLQNVNSWLYTTSKNKIIDRYRKRKNIAVTENVPAQDDDFAGVKEILLADTTQNPELLIFKKQFWQLMDQALSELPQNQQYAFRANEFEQKTLREIAEEEGVSIKTIISRKQYAVKHLKKVLLPLYNDFILQK